METQIESPTVGSVTIIAEEEISPNAVALVMDRSHLVSILASAIVAETTMAETLMGGTLETFQSDGVEATVAADALARAESLREIAQAIIDQKRAMA